MTALIKRLPENIPLDIVGDVHGEIGALNRLLASMGYGPDGSHPQGRKLVFLGDLVDRGPDSPTVLERVISMVRAGHAWCVMGNHEMNILRNERKDGNDWIMAPDKVPSGSMHTANMEERHRYQAFIASLPLALERSDLRIVHACWHDASIAALRQCEPPVAGLYKRYEENTRKKFADQGLAAAHAEQLAQFKVQLLDRSWEPAFLEAVAATEAGYQMDNPLRVITSGVEEPIQGVRRGWYDGELPPAMAPFWAGGKWRMVTRVKWWERYTDAVPVIMGHYWRRFSDAHTVMPDKFGPDLFAGIEPHHWMGPNRNIYCVDFSVGLRATARDSGTPEAAGQLAALRVPEWRVMHDGGDQWDIGQPGT